MAFLISEDYKSPELEVAYHRDKRFYLSPGGVWLGSASSVVGHGFRNKFDWWRKKASKEELARAEAQKILSGARGTELHSHLERYLEFGKTPTEYEYPHVDMMFDSIKYELDKNVDFIYGMEQPLYSEELMIAGRYDLIAKWKGDPAVIDFKNSTKLKKLEWIENYILQEAAYALMFYGMFGIPVKKLVTLIAVEGMRDIQIFEVDLKNEHIDKLWKFVQEFREEYTYA